MKKYKAIFLTGTVRLSSPGQRRWIGVVVPMKKLLAEGVKLAVISGTTINNIGDGKLHRYFTPKERKPVLWPGAGSLQLSFYG